MADQMTGKKLRNMVDEALAKEEAWKPLDLKVSTTKPGASVTYEHRADILKWQSRVALQFQFYPEAEALAVSILDKFLTCVKVQTKYLKCVALTCLYIASKMTEEDEIVPHISDLVTHSSANCTTDDIVRMERLILNKLDWSINLPTPLHFLQVCHAYLYEQQPDLLVFVPHMTSTRQLDFLTHKLQMCVCSEQFCQWSPSLVAVSLLSLELEEFRSDWLPLTLNLLKFIKKSNFTELIGCREDMAFHMSMELQRARAEQAAMGRQQKRVRHQTGSSSNKRKMTSAPEDQEDIYSSIQSLYNEVEVDDANESDASVAAKLANED